MVCEEAGAKKEKKVDGKFRQKNASPVDLGGARCCGGVICLSSGKERDGVGMGEASGYNVDSTVGGLVWVQRRNGSWWPGQILCPDELPKSSLASPRRSGVPVKLLGREDVSVEWYNLEKSKRVKPFRCGEYDECIEKAKVTAAVSCKKAGKCAHREDAILQALELENFQLSENNNPDAISVSPQELSRFSASADDSLDCSRQRTLNDSEDDETEGSMKRKQGLEDFGIGRASSSFKKKRSGVVHIHDFLKKKYRRRQLSNVLKKTEIVTVPVMFEEFTGLDGPDFSNNKMSIDTDNVINSHSDANDCRPKENENSSNSELRDNDDSSRLFDVPFIREGKHATGSSPGLVPEMGRVGTGPKSSQSSPVETASVESDELQQCGSISSKWQNKGKRNSRNKNKTKTVQKILDLDYEIRKVNSMVDPTAQQRSMPIRQSRSKKSYTGSLYDVSIEVKAGHFTRHVPYVSLLSNFTGQHITGHLLEVNVLKDTVSDLSSKNSQCRSSCELGGVNKVDEDVEMVSRHSKRQRRNGLSSNKKIRRLSSLTTSKKPSETGTLKRPDLACVPLKLVFARIYAALGISSS
ncbi:hypothetical protein M8C21_018262 [Ambrosia artemisiifolia]|uniref:PWWP domain-containing protein n=1 Tax=Ambrosia artemisiifolia TaxID=4212 RepID=A0AAD5CCT1_AMBAR|nr:hypothetical protein M8C21_018262 [Ambrosia artemisiifolia]